MFTEKQHKQIAEILRNALSGDTSLLNHGEIMEEICGAFADCFEEDNSCFDREKFLRNSGDWR